MITIFKSVTDITTPFYPSIESILKRIKNGEKKDLIRLIRAEKDKGERNILKKQLPAICFSGKFSKRHSNSLIEHSGIICLDFDGYNTKNDMLQFKDDLKEEAFVYSVFVSPSGNGLKVLVRIPPEAENHVLYFNALEEYFSSDEFDSACKDVGRVCYESYDPKIYINNDSEIWTEKSDDKAKVMSRNEAPPTIIINDATEIINRLMVWWNRDFGFIDGEKNNNLHKLACAMSNYGVSQEQTLSHIVYICSTDSGKAPLSELKSLVRSAYNMATFNNKVFEDRDKVESIRKQLKQGVTVADVKTELIKTGVNEVDAKEIVKEVSKTAHDNIQIFWSKSDKGKVSILHNLFKEFLTDNGYYKFYPEGSKNFIFVRKISNIVNNATGNNIKDFVLKYLETKVEDVSVWNHFADNVRYFKEDFLSMLPKIEINFIEDTEKEAYLFYKNVTVMVTEDDITTINYEDIQGWVWEDQMIKRDYVKKNVKTCDFKKFIGHISGNDSGRISSIESTIGFLLHGFKDSSECPAVILNDEVISDNPEGGTGKGIFAKAIGELKMMVGIDGKSFDFGKSFPYQTVSVDTQVLTFDDVKPGFDFERLFSLITEGLTLEKKNKDAIKVPFGRSPKIMITTNYAIRGGGESHERRKWELEFKQYYKRGHTPKDEFGRRLFDGWDTAEYCLFDNYMIGNLKSYLKTGFVKSKFMNLKARKFIAETCHPFYEWMSQTDCMYNQPGIELNSQTAYNSFTTDYTDYGPKSKLTISKIKFNIWMSKYAVFKFGTEMENGRSADGKWIRYTEIDKKKDQKQIDF